MMCEVCEGQEFSDVQWGPEPVSTVASVRMKRDGYIHCESCDTKYLTDGDELLEMLGIQLDSIQDLFTLLRRQAREAEEEIKQLKREKV